ncbi:alpha/beta fold hydrolase [Rothia mucilaginosa]|uniref:alpha/beta fold hydrolase n=1 Tax=Rothia mucilaginosa TaxID=43675 RepID=UPI0027B9C1FE|nr:alpha/beta hydrolase [Rothia mucilaginosa]
MTSTVTPDSPNTSVLEGVPGPLIPGTRHDALIGDGAQAVMTRYWQYGKGMNAGLFPEGSYPVLLVHGFRGDHHGLEIIANYLLKLIPNVSIISPDLPGFGRSADLPEGTQDEGAQGEDNINAYVAWLNDFVKHTNPAREDAQPLPLHLVGHSFGSIVTSAFAAAHPNSLALLSLINPISEPALEGSQRVASRLASLYYRAGAALPEKIGYPLLRSQLITRASSEVMMRTKDKAMRRFINGQHAAYFGSFGSRRGVLSAYEASITHTAAEYAAAIRVPVQMLVAEDDDLGTPETARAMYATLTSRSLPVSRSLPASSSGARERLDMIPEVGHLIHYETPHLAAELIADFAAGHSGNEK